MKKKFFYNYNYHFISYFLIFTIIISCSHQMTEQKDSFLCENDNYNIDIRDPGIFILNNGLISIKCRNKPFISILDILAYKLRFNYTLSTDMHSFTLTICNKVKNSNSWNDSKQLIFKNANVFFMYAINRMNEDYIPDNSKISFRWIGDGPEFFRIFKSKGKKILVNENVIIKKIFLNCVAVKDDETNNSQNITLPEITNEVMPLQQPAISDTMYQNNNVISRIESLLTQIEKEKVNILEVETQNALLLRGDRKTINYISNIIFSMDVEYPQVLVETKVFEYDDSLAKKIGTTIQYSKKFQSPKGSSNYEITNHFYEEISENFDFKTNIPSFFFNLTDEEKKMNLLTNLALYGRNGLVKILAEPRLLLKPGSKASIKLTTVKYVDASTQEFSQIDNQSIDCGILFEIIPIILAENKILLKIKLKQSEFITNNEKQIVQTKNENIIDTTVVALDGELINIGGIILKKTSASSSGIPYIKDIPYLGQLFESNQKEYSKVRIEFMIKPTVKFLSQKLNKIKKDIHKHDQLFEKNMKRHFSF